MMKVLNRMKNGMPCKTASRRFSVPVTTLKGRTKGKNKNGAGGVKTSGSIQTVFRYVIKRKNSLNT